MCPCVHVSCVHVCATAGSPSPWLGPLPPLCLLPLSSNYLPFLPRHDPLFSPCTLLFPCWGLLCPATPRPHLLFSLDLGLHLIFPLTLRPPLPLSPSLPAVTCFSILAFLGCPLGLAVWDSVCLVCPSVSLAVPNQAPGEASGLRAGRGGHHPRPWLLPLDRLGEAGAPGDRAAFPAAPGQSRPGPVSPCGWARVGSS